MGFVQTRKRPLLIVNRTRICQAVIKVKSNTCKYRTKITSIKSLAVQTVKLMLSTYAMEAMPPCTVRWWHQSRRPEKFTLRVLFMKIPSGSRDEVLPSRNRPPKILVGLMVQKSLTNHQGFCKTLPKKNGINYIYHFFAGFLNHRQYHDSKGGLNKNNKFMAVPSKSIPFPRFDAPNPIPTIGL